MNQKPTNRRGSYRSRRIETKRRDDDRRRESADYDDDERKRWVSLRNKQVAPAIRIRPRYLTPTDIDPENQAELLRAVAGESMRLDRYKAARMVVADAIERGLVREACDGTNSYI